MSNKASELTLSKCGSSVSSITLNLHYIYRYIYQTLLSKATYNKYICHKKVKQYIAVGTIRMFIEPSAESLMQRFHVFAM